VEGVIIPAKSTAYGQAGSLGPVDAAGNNHRSGVEHDLNGPKQHFPLRAPDKLQQNAHGVLNRTPQITQRVLQTPPQFYSAMHREPVQEIPAPRAAEDDEETAGRRLAARFVRPAAEAAQAAPRRSMPGLRSFLAAGVFFAAAACASAVYFSRSDVSAPAASTYAATVSEEPSEASFAVEKTEAQQDEDRELSFVQAPAAGDSWASAVETFRALAGAQAASAPQDRAAEPASKQLAARDTAKGPQ